MKGNALTDNHPFAELIAKYADAELLRAIARAHRKGRRLFVQTTNLDAQRPVIWDMGAIADSGAPKALHLFRQILRASASIPALFPPVEINVEAAGEYYQEMHVDGGTVSEQTALSAWLFGARGGFKIHELQPRLTMYVVRNSTFAPEWQNVENRTLAIAQRAAQTVLKYQGIADLYVAYDAARERDFDFNLTGIGTDFRVKYVGPFNKAYMNKLFDYGYDKGRTGPLWMKTPPGIARTSSNRSLFDHKAALT